jgi:hypothetical protein
MDHKRIGVMYTPLAILMPLGFNDAIIIRSLQAFGFREPNRAARETALSVLSRNDRFDDRWAVEQRAQ